MKPKFLANLGPFGEWLHRKRWSRRNIRMMLAADALVVSHTKSGRTWLRVMISYLYHLKYGTPASEIMGFDNLHRMNPKIPRIYYTRDTVVPTFSRTRSDVVVPDDKKIVTLIRDPRDVALSFYFHVVNRASERELARKEIPLKTRGLTLYEFVIDPVLGVPRVIEHFNRWQYELSERTDSMVVRYEDMRKNPAAVLTNIIRFIDCEFSATDISRAVEFASFDNLARKEKEGYFSSSRMTSDNPEDENSRKVRRGKVGGYRDYFDEEQAAVLDTMVRDTLYSGFGYS